MKRNLLLLAAALCMTVGLQAQSKKYVLFEHFTQASCGPCATQNPAFEAVRAQNASSTHHIAYHTAWPGVDPMNSINPSEVQTRVNYYTVSGVPRMHMLGNTWSGSPVGVSSDLIGANATTAPVRLRLEDMRSEEGTHDVTLVMQETGEVTGLALKLRVAVIEKNISYASAPGTNGEREFPNVFRKMLTPSGGITYLPSGEGTDQSFSFTYEELDDYNPEELYVIAWLQDEANKTVINSGSNLDPNWQFVNQSPSLFASAGDTFEAKYVSDVEGTTVRVITAMDAPDDWTYNVSANGVDLGTANEQITVDGNELTLLSTLTPGTTAGVGRLIVAVQNITANDEIVSSVSYTAMSAISDLIIDHGGVASQWNEDYITGLTAAGNSGFGTMPVVYLEDAWNSGALDDVVNIYDNISWTFPSFTNTEVDVLSQYLDAGGNLFVNGQDIGWDTWDPSTSANGTDETKAFYTDYLRAEYLGDGSGTNNQLTWTGDDVFGDPGSSTIIDVYNGNIYPDEMNPIEPAVALFNYNNNPAKSGAVRVEENGHKIVYVGVDMGMIADEAVRSALISITHDWFYGIISSTEYDNLIKEALGQNFPNPAANFTTIPLSNLEKDAALLVTDINGKIIHSGKVTIGQSTYTLDVSSLTAGSYYYYLKTDEGQSEPQKIQVVK